MFKRIKNILQKDNLKLNETPFSRKLPLKGTPGENARDAFLVTGIKAAEESAYALGNATDKLVNATEQLQVIASEVSDNVLEVATNVKGVADQVNDVTTGIKPLIQRTVSLVTGTEAGQALGKITYKTTKDMARGDSVCTGLCLISATSEAVALGCGTIKYIPFRGRIYIGAKIVSKSCMTYRNLCAGEGC